MLMKLQENWRDWRASLAEPHLEQMFGRQSKERELSELEKEL